MLQNILVAGKPHLGTDRLIKILQAFRKHLTVLGVQIHFGSCVTNLVIEHNKAVGVKLRGQQLTKRASCLLYVSMPSNIALSPQRFALGKPESESESDPESESEPGPESEYEFEYESESESDSEVDFEAKPESEAKSEAESCMLS